MTKQPQQCQLLMLPPTHAEAYHALHDAALTHL